MAMGDPYVTLAELKVYMGQTGGAAQANDSELTDAIASATSEINRHCNRQFNQASTATARLYKPSTMRVVKVDDFWTTASLLVETDPGGTNDFSQQWTANDYELSPVNGIVDGELGWPYNKLRTAGGFYFPLYGGVPYRRENTVRITAKWGWEAVPASVKQACKILAHETWKLRDVPFGVAGVSGVAGGYVMRVRDNPLAARKLAKYVRNPVLVG